MSRRLAVALAIILSCSAVAIAAQTELVDRVLASVDEDPILQSDIEQLVLLGTVQQGRDESDELFQRRVLDLVIEQTLRFHEVDQFGFTELPAAEIDDRVAIIRRRYRSQGAFDEALAAVGLDESGLREVIARQLMVLTYVDERLGARVFVSLDDIQEYYRETLVPDLQRRGTDVPPLSAVREDIRAVLRETRLNEEIDRWTAELRAEADVINNLDKERGELPPVVTTLTDQF